MTISPNTNQLEAESAQGEAEARGGQLIAPLYCASSTSEFGNSMPSSKGWSTDSGSA